MASTAKKRSVAATQANFTRQLNAIKKQVAEGLRTYQSGNAQIGVLRRTFRAKGLNV